jgi:adenylate cyclase
VDSAASYRRRLAAILAADVAGYSRLMSLDDHLTIASLESAREVFRASIQAHQGRVVDMAGDSVLAIFDTAASAVEAGIAAQSSLALRAVDVPQERRMEFRIGVHLGDITEKPDGSIYGDGVNIASRLEGLAPPGGVVVSDAVRSSVRNRVKAEFEDLGEKQVKNIQDPVRAFRVVAKGSSDQISVELSPWRRAVSTFVTPRTLVAFVTVLVLAVAVLLMFAPSRSSTDKSQPALLSVAVLPLASAKPTDAEIVRRLSLELTRWLAQTVVGHSVKPAAAVQAFRGDVRDLRALGAELNVRYVVQGSVDRDERQLAVTVELVDAQKAEQVWSAQIATAVVDRETELVERSVTRILSQLRPAIYEAQAKSLERKPSGRVSAFELAFRGLYVQSSLDYKTQIDISNEECDSALRLDPSLAIALYCKAHTLEWVLFGEDPGSKAVLDPKRLSEMDELTARAVAMDRSDADLWNMRANVLRYQRKWDGMVEARGRALKLNPSLVEAYVESARDAIRLGQPGEALVILAKAAEIDSGGSEQDNLLLVKCRAYLGLADFQESINSCEKLASGGLGQIGWRVLLAAAYAQVGQLDKAADVRDRAIAEQRGLTIASWRAVAVANGDTPAYVDQVDRNIVEGMRKAGFPER